MRKYCPGLLLALLCLAAPAGAKEPFRFPAGRHGAKAELKYVNDVPVLVVAGAPAEMGAAVGALALKPGKRVLEYPHDLLRGHSADGIWGLIVRGGNGMFRHFPPDYRRELEAMVRVAGVERDAVIVGNTFFDLKKFMACSAVMVDGKRSRTGGPLLGRNLDYPSLDYIHQYSLVTVYRPTGKHAFATVGFPGLVGCLSGMNDAGLTVAILEVFKTRDGEPDFNPNGVPYALCHRKLLEECTTIDQAKKLLEKMKRTTTLNLAVADRSGVAVLEVTPGHVVRRDAVSGVCACTNHFCVPALRPEKPIYPCGSLDRFRALERLVFRKDKVGPDDLRQRLDAANLGELTLQTMVFEPATLQLHLSIGKVPASAGPLRTVDLAPLFKTEVAKKIP